MQPTLTPQEFVTRWQNTQLSERASYQMHFADVCKLIGYEAPSGSGTDTHGNVYAFEHSLTKLEGTTGFADVFLQGHFAIEYKAPGKYRDLRAAYDQLLQYREQLHNPPLLIVTDIENWEIHTNWPNTEKRVYAFSHDEIATRTVVQDYLRSIFFDPQRLHPNRNKAQVTQDAAKTFEIIADNMRGWDAEPERIAHFLTKLVFCLFAEDVALLPPGPKGDAGIFTEIIEQTRDNSARFVRYAEDLFKAMADGGDVLFQKIPYFNGSLFEDVRVEELQYEALIELERAAALNWESVEPAIFGTLFERSLDPDKRSQLGAHYTSREDILLIVEPVLMRPLERQWDDILEQAQSVREKYEAAMQTSNRRNQTRYANDLKALREEMLSALREVRVLDPACGSGNFLYVALQRLMDMEKAVIMHPLFAGLDTPFPEVHPRQMYGIEKNEIAHALASIVVWIGFLQWRRTNGYLTTPKEPILEALGDNIRCMDAILAYDDEGNPAEPDWPQVDVIIGNPPFLGDKKMRGELGDEYVDKLRQLYQEKIPGGADFVTYWFEKARAQIEGDKARRAGLLATNSIRQGANRTVLDQIKATGDIFLAWSDRAWTLDGAAVRVSMVGFDNGTETEKFLDGSKVDIVNSDLSSGIDVTKVSTLTQNQDICFLGMMKAGSFDIDGKLAREMLSATNIAGVPNSDVIKPRMGGRDVTQRPRDIYIIDFGVYTTREEASQYEMPYSYVVKHIKPHREKNRRRKLKENWWIFGEARPALRDAISSLKRCIVTPEVSKFRVFTWMDTSIIPDHKLHVIARDDDYFFGVLHSKLHEVWSLAIGSWMGKGNDPVYASSKTFGTFPFPWSPGQEDTASAAYGAISAAAQQLHEERDAWLNDSRNAKDRTLTNLYNALAVFRGEDSIKIKAVAGDFAPRLAELHDALDRAVCDAYGWDHAILDDEDAMLRHLLALNLERAE